MIKSKGVQSYRIPVNSLGKHSGFAIIRLGFFRLNPCRILLKNASLGSFKFRNLNVFVNCTFNLDIEFRPISKKKVSTSGLMPEVETSVVNDACLN